MDRRIVATCLFAVLATWIGRVQAECMPGLSTPGITTPSGDIILEEGSPLKINCTLNSSHQHAQGRNSSDLTFYQGDKEVAAEYITILNHSTIQLHLNDLPVSKYIYYCKLRQPHERQHIAVCLNEVIVGSKPEEVQNFTCISQNWESLTCKWTIKPNPVKTTYKIFFNLPGRAGRRFNATCPVDTDVKGNMCMWNQRTNPIYRQPYEYYYFALTGENALGTVAFPAVKFHHYAHVIPASPVQLQAHNVTSNSVVLTWSVPFPLQNFPRGLLHRVEYNCRWEPEGHWEVANTSSLNAREKNLTFTLTDLAYAYTVYHIRVSLKSSAAVGEGKWSTPASVTIRTAATIPGASPKTDIGSFELIGSMPHRDVYIYWQQIPMYLQNGDNFDYKIIHEEDSGENTLLTPNETTMSYAKIKGLSFNSYKFIIYASNSVGLSKNPSIITIPSHTASLPEPLSFTNIAFGNGIYELSWRRPPDFQNIQNYTIFWCDNERDGPYQCTGFLNWTHVPHDVYITNITVPEDKTYQFAISANTVNSSSGLLWATCTVMHNKGIGKMKNVWVNKVGSTFIEVGWKLECSARIGLVMGYRIYYCPIVSPVNRTCRGQIKNSTVPGDSLNIHGNITDLMPYTTYKVSISVISRGGEGLQSDSQLATTLEAAPEAPTRVEVTEVSNTSLVVSWDPPRLMNGVLQYYEVHYNDRSKQVEGDTRVKLQNLPSHTNISVYVTACTGSCSEPSEAITIQTAFGNPGEVERLTVRRMNVSQFLVRWQPPTMSNGNIHHYDLNVKKVDGTNKSFAHTFHISGTEYTIPVLDCSAEDNKQTYVFEVRAVNKDTDGIELPGPWSGPQERDNCLVSGFSFLNVTIWIVCIMIFCVMCLALWFYGKKWWNMCKEMRNVEVKLPPGLDPPRDKDHLSLSSCSTGQRPIEAPGKRQPADLADSELLLNERHGRNPSGDSSGCSSGNDSVSSSLTSNTQISSDSGAEVDQLNMNAESAGSSHMQKCADPSNWDLYPKLNRYSNGSAHSVPNLNTEEDAGAPKYTCLNSTPSSSHLPSSNGHSPLNLASSSLLFCTTVSADSSPSHLPPSYCRVGTSAASDDNPLRSPVPNSSPSNGYVALSRVAELSRPPAPPAPISSSGYVAHMPLWNATNVETPVAPAIVSVVSTPSSSTPTLSSPGSPPLVSFPDATLPIFSVPASNYVTTAPYTNSVTTNFTEPSAFSNLPAPSTTTHPSSPSLSYPPPANSLAVTSSGDPQSQSDETYKELTVSPAGLLGTAHENKDSYCRIGRPRRPAVSNASSPETTPIKNNGYVKLGVDGNSPQSAVSSTPSPPTPTPITLTNSSSGYVALGNQWPLDGSHAVAKPSMSATSSPSSVVYVPHRKFDKGEPAPVDAQSHEGNLSCSSSVSEQDVKLDLGQGDGPADLPPCI